MPNNDLHEAWKSWGARELLINEILMLTPEQAKNLIGKIHLVRQLAGVRYEEEPCNDGNLN